MIWYNIYDTRYTIWYGMILYMIRYDIWYDTRYTIWYGIWYDIWNGMIKYDIIYDMIYDTRYTIWYGMIWYDIRYDMIKYDIIYDMIRYMIWHDKIWYYMIWYDIWYMGGKQWQPTPKNLPRMQCARAISVAWLGSGSCLTGLRAEY
jgi:hypothetical protein